MVAKVTKYGHASKAITITDANDNHLNEISHINPGYKEEQFSLRNFYIVMYTKLSWKI